MIFGRIISFRSLAVFLIESSRDGAAAPSAPIRSAPLSVSVWDTIGSEMNRCGRTDTSMMDTGAGMIELRWELIVAMATSRINGRRLGNGSAPRRNPTTTATKTGEKPPKKKEKGKKRKKSEMSQKRKEGGRKAKIHCRNNELQKIKRAVVDNDHERLLTFLSGSKKEIPPPPPLPSSPPPLLLHLRRFPAPEFP